jgi:hypothetical protein
VTIDASSPVFPNNVVDLIATRAQALDADLQILKRPLRASDPIQCVGVFGMLWTPNEDSIEFRGTPGSGPGLPTISRYTITVQGLIKDTDDERGLYVHSVLAKMLRSMLYRDTALRVGFAALSVTDLTGTESTSQWGLGTTRYYSNEIKGTWLYLSVLDFWLETEMK